jgi:hypothetical protein
MMQKSYEVQLFTFAVPAVNHPRYSVSLDVRRNSLFARNTNAL